jgi:hypothetical protein
MMVVSKLRISAESSTTTTRIFCCVIAFDSTVGN